MAETPADGLVSADQGAELLGVPASTIRKWKERGRVIQAGSIPGRGRSGEVPLYRLDELRPLAADYRRRKCPLAELIEAAEIRPIDPCPVCGVEVQAVLLRVTSDKGIATPCMHAVTVTIGPEVVGLARWAPRRV